MAETTPALPARVLTRWRTAIAALFACAIAETDGAAAIATPSIKDKPAGIRGQRIVIIARPVHFGA